MNGQKIVDFALTEVGYHEGANKDNKYGVWLGLNYVAECAEGVSYFYAMGGFPLGAHDFQKGWTSVPHMLKYYTAKGELTDDPKPGDIVIMAFKVKGGAEHVGIFVKDNGDGTITTIEANTSNPNHKGSESNGGWTMEKIRSKELVTAFVHPKVLDVTATV